MENTATGTGAIIFDADMSNFMPDVIERSMQVPVLVDFWATWCEPCKTLGPILEKVVSEANGAVVMAKVDIDKTQEIAAQMQIRSVPTVVAFIDGRPVDAFAGVKTESEIREFIEKIAPEVGPSESAKLIEYADQAFEAENYQEAGGAYSQALQMEPDNIQATAGLANSLIKLGDLENAEQVLSGAADKNDPVISAALAALETAKQLGDIGYLDALIKAAQDNPDDYQAKFDLSLALWAANKRDEAAQELLDIIAADRSWQDDGARTQLLKFFEMAGPMDPFTVAARRKLSSLLFS
ncbi:thioredoxin [Pseudemcibacter aquimaris]|uniref:thioredoxin n=1 Tax=Pseudemcibacter aquimaris TaxID=2857064 RepID=UPI002013880A|nr:thioredoxin [Pseudemcibacter aquimaris]MCC3861679.1 thioredoxin [Pseudemcibacter aquimaris]WDU58450.1 thioredoxin [Pseudemcibacter aquimaris]